MKEKWRIYPYNDNYEVSNMGRVRRAKDLARGYECGGLLKPQKNTYNYLHVRLGKRGKCKTCTIHKLVLETFVGNRPDGMECNHKNTIKTDNRLENLEWITSSDNSLHAYENGLQNAVGENNSQSKITESGVIKIKKLYGEGWKQKDIAIRFNVTRANVSKIICKQSWKYLKS